jgi:Lysyl oxidase/WD40-like Beta Propeller Repeat
VIAAVAATAAIRPEPRDARMLVESGSALVAVTPAGVRGRVLDDAQDGAYSPDGTMLAFARAGDLWVANADGSGQRRLARTPNVEEWGPSWLPNGHALVYTARVGGERQIWVLQLPTGPSVRIAASGSEEWSPTLSSTGRLAFVSTRGGTPAVYVAQANGYGATAFDMAAPAIPPVDVRDLAWSPDGKRLAYTSEADDGTTSLTIDDGTTQTVLSAAPAHDEHPVWSPTGTRIAYDDGDDNLSSVAADGTDQRALGEGQPLDWRNVPIGKPKFPNLVQRVPSGLVVIAAARGRWLLGFTSMVDNRGPGILWIRGNRSGNSHVMQVRQLVQLSGGGTRIFPDSGELHYTVAPPHYHWHFLSFDRYELHRSGDFRLLVRDHKSGFCIADHYGLAPGMAHGPPRFLGSCAQFDPQARFVEEGASVGYTDRYPAFFHGQALDITKVHTGNYWLVHRANPDFHLRESHYGDDAASLLVRITWPAGRRAPPRVTPLRGCAHEHC